jgi:hypothetical protein
MDCRCFLWCFLNGFLYRLLRLMLIRTVQQITAGQKVILKHDWVPMKKISPHMQLAAVCSEDQNFLKHHGIDFKAIEKARNESKRKNGRLRGASTISQQTAKNVFLWPQRSWVRKGLEVWFTGLIELIWGKKRILEVYLNSIEMGMGFMVLKLPQITTLEPALQNLPNISRHQLLLFCQARENGTPKIRDLMSEAA